MGIAQIWKHDDIVKNSKGKTIRDPVNKSLAESPKRSKTKTRRCPEILLHKKTVHLGGWVRCDASVAL